jgi:hypothetical protein
MSGDRIPVRARFSAKVQTVPGAHPASYIMDIMSFPGVKWSGRGFHYRTPSDAEVKGKVDVNILTPSGFSWPVLGWTLTLTLHQWKHKSLYYAKLNGNGKNDARKMRSRCGSTYCTSLTRCVILQKSIDKPRYTEASTLCKVPGNVRTIIMELVRFFLA